MELRTFADPGAFIDLAGHFMAGDPWTTNVIGVEVAGVLSGVRPLGPSDRWWTVIDATGPIGVAMRTPPYPLAISRMPPEAAAFLAHELSAGGPQPALKGEVATVAAFVAAWETASGERSEVQLRERFYRLAELIPPAVTGHGRRPGPPEGALVESWFAAFQVEALPHHSGPRHQDVARRRLDAGQVWLWEDEGRAVALAAVSPPANGVARVGPVYTPPEHRRHGYGSAVTALVAQAALGAGADHVTLFADLSNPTSNAIYQTIGFVSDHDVEEHRFLAKTDSGRSQSG